MSLTEAWALDPWTTDSVRFLPVPPDGRAAWLVPAPLPPSHASRVLMPMRATTTWRKEYASLALGRRFIVYVAERDEDRLLTALQAAERVLSLLALVGGAS